MTVSYWLEDHNPKQELEVDVAIVGGGIMGATAAYWLSQRKGVKAAIIESQRPGWGASGRNGGLVLRGTDAYYNQSVKAHGRETARAVFEFNQQTHAHLTEFMQKHGNDFFYDQCGSYLLACSLDELNQLEESADLMHEDGFEVEYLKYDPLERDYYGALYNACDIGVHSGLLVESVIRASGVPVYNNEQVYRFESLPDGKTLVYTNGMRVKAERVLLLTNAYSALLEPWFIGKMHPMRGQVMVTKPLKKRILSNLCYANFGYEYFRQLPDDRFLLGGAREAFIDEEITFTDAPTQNIQTALHNYVRDRFPEVAGVPVDFRWAGIMSFTKDGLPLLGELVKIKGKGFSSTPEKNEVSFNSKKGQVTQSKATELQVRIPKDADIGDNKVSAKINGQKTNELKMVIRGIPEISGTNLQGVPPGYPVIVFGKNFSKKLNENQVYFDKTSAQLVSGNETQLTVIAPTIPYREGHYPSEVTVQVGKVMSKNSARVQIGPQMFNDPGLEEGKGTPSYAP